MVILTKVVLFIQMENKFGIRFDQFIYFFFISPTPLQNIQLSLYAYQCIGTLKLVALLLQQF